MIASDLLRIALVVVGGLSVMLAMIFAVYAAPRIRWTRYAVPAVLLILAAGFVCWAACFIEASSVLVDGTTRYYVLYDDAMISMRYAWNFAHGHGLVWNPGEPVEGYTNLLMTLIMSPFTRFLDKSFAVLGVQILGIALALANAGLLRLIAGYISRDAPPLRRAWLKTLAFACGLLYFPLIYWPLIGGDLGPLLFFMLLGVLAAFKGVDHPHERRWPLAMSIALGLAYLTRPDAAIPAVVILAYFVLARRGTWTSWAAVGVFLLFPLGQTLFRLAYYGELLPNTYILKVSGVPLAARLTDGLTFIRPFLESTWWLFTFALISLVLRFEMRRLMALLIAFGLIVYQVWIGGDIAVNNWRIIALLMPLLLLFYADDLLKLAAWIAGRLRSPVIGSLYLHYGLAALVLGISLYAANYPQLATDIFVTGALNRDFHTYLVNVAAALDEVTTPDATIAVTAAGVIPYYTGRYTIDMLGKSDPHIARLPPLLGSFSQGGMLNYPGHIKYDLNYSIVGKQPDYVEKLAWGWHNVEDWAQTTYVTVVYRGMRLRLRRESPRVRWEVIDNPHR